MIGIPNSFAFLFFDEVDSCLLYTSYCFSSSVGFVSSSFKSSICSASSDLSWNSTCWMHGSSILGKGVKEKCLPNIRNFQLIRPRCKTPGIGKLTADEVTARVRRIVKGGKNLSLIHISQIVCLKFIGFYHIVIRQIHFLMTIRCLLYTSPFQNLYNSCLCICNRLCPLYRYSKTEKW